MNQYNNDDLSLEAAIITIFLCTAFGSNAVAVKISLSAIGPITNAGIRFTLAAAGIFLWARLTGKSFSLNRRQLYQLLILSVIFVIQFSLFHVGLNKTNASRGTILINFQPFFLLILAHIFIPGDRITLRKFIGIILGFTGVMLVFLEKKGITSDFQIGDILILSATILWAVNIVYTKRIIHEYKPYYLAFYPMIFSSPFFFLGGFLWDTKMISFIDLQVSCSLLYQGFFIGSLGFVAWNTLLQRYGAFSLHSFVFIIPISGVALGWLLLGEPITIKILLALIFILLGILVIHLKEKDNFRRYLRQV